MSDPASICDVGERAMEGEQTEIEGHETHSDSRAGVQWPTVDGSLGVHSEEALKLARNFYYAGFLLLPMLWFVNCFYFWPVLRHREAEPLIRPYVVRSGVGCLLFCAVLLTWALTFSFGGEHLFGSAWKHMAVYDVADKYEMAFQ